MFLVLDLVLLHLSATALLLVVFVAVSAYQRTADLIRRRRDVPRTADAASPQAAGAPGRDVTIGLRTPAAAHSGAMLQQTS